MLQMELFPAASPPPVLTHPSPSLPACHVQPMIRIIRLIKSISRRVLVCECARVLTRHSKQAPHTTVGYCWGGLFKHKHGIINPQLLKGRLWLPRAACIDFPFKAASKSRRRLKEPREGTVTLCINRQSQSENEAGAFSLSEG